MRPGIAPPVTGSSRLSGDDWDRCRTRVALVIDDSSKTLRRVDPGAPRKKVGETAAATRAAWSLAGRRGDLPGILPVTIQQDQPEQDGEDPRDHPGKHLRFHASDRESLAGRFAN